MATPRALICDLDGVLRNYDVKAQLSIEGRHGLPAGAIAAAAFTSPLLRDAVTGRIDDAEWRRAVAQDLAAEHGSVAVAAMHEWSDLRATAARDVLPIIRRVRKRAPVVVLTNATSSLAIDLEHLGLAAEVDAIVNSADVGVAKPDTGAFLAARDAAARLLGQELLPGNLAFVDDTAGHVRAAELLGWRGHVFVDARQLRNFLQTCDLLYEPAP